MHFGEFLRANIIEGLEDAYLDYQLLVAIVEGSKGDDDQLRIGSTPMPLSTGGPSVHKQAKRVVSRVLTRIAVFFIFLRSSILRLCGYCTCCKGDGEGQVDEGVDPYLLNEPLIVPCESIKINRGEDSLLGERHEEFLCAMHGELARCNDFLAAKEAELEASIDSLVSTIQSFMGSGKERHSLSSHSAEHQSPRPSFEGGSDLPGGSPERPGDHQQQQHQLTKRYQGARARSQSESASDSRRQQQQLPPLPPGQGGKAGRPDPVTIDSVEDAGGEISPPAASPNVSPRSSFRASPRPSMTIESRGRALSADAYSDLSGLHLHSPSRRNSDAHPSSAGRHMSRYTPTPLFQAIWSQPDTIEHAYRELHVHIMQLKQVATVNLTGFQKAAKKCKKNTLTAIKTKFSEETCCKSSKMDDLADKLAKSYAKHFTNNNIAKARATLMIYKGSVQPSLKVGFFLGIDVALTLCLIWVTMYSPAKEDCPYCVSSLIEVIPVYRVIFFPILFIWGWSALVYLWRSFGINYLWILDMDPKTELGIQGSASLAATMTSFCLLSLLLYTAAVKTGFSLLQLPLYVWPLTLFLVTFLACIAPPGAFYYKSRKWFFQTLAIIAQRVVAFFGPEVRFRENYVADVLTSMVAWIVDFENTIIYYVAGHGFHPGDSSNHPKHVLTAHILTGIPYYYRVQVSRRASPFTAQVSPPLPYSPCRLSLSLLRARDLEGKKVSGNVSLQPSNGRKSCPLD